MIASLFVSIMLGVQPAPPVVAIQYSGPPPGPVLAPAPPPRVPLFVFFDRGQTGLTDHARGVVRETVGVTRQMPYTQVEVIGHTDTEGSPEANLALSTRRAAQVADELVRNGIPRQAIVIKGAGDTSPLVPTGPNVSEPQNRRVEIVVK
jgi:outer membrane protein OmpA-like peptidoglycan-associated protein